MQLLKDKVAVITGGNSGIGLAIARKFHQEGAKVVLFGRSNQKLQEALKTLEGAIAYAGDVTKTSDLEALYQMTREKFGKIDILVANAGVAELCPLEEVDEELFDRVVNINYKGVYFTVQRATPHLNENASVILMASVAAHVGWPSHSVYSSSKAAVSYLASSFSTDLIKRGIRVNALSPGFVDTPIFDAAKEAYPEKIEQLKENVPVKRFAEADEIAEAALYLASPKSSYVIGIDLVIDGGLQAIFPAKL